MTRDMARNKGENHGILHDYAAKVGFTPADFGTSTARDSLYNYVEKKASGTADEKKEVLAAIKALDGSDTSFEHFLKKYDEKLVD